MAKQRRSLSVTLLWPLAILSMLVIVAVVLVYFTVSQRLSKDFLNKRATEIAELVTVKVETNVATSSLERVISAVGSYDDVDEIMVVHLESGGIVKSANHRRYREKPLSDVIDSVFKPVVNELIEQKRKAPFFRDHPSKNNRYVYFYPFSGISEDRRSVVSYLIYIEVNDSSLVETLESFLFPSLAVQLSVLILSLILFYVLVRKVILSPIKQMLWAIDHASDNARVKVSSANENDEMGVLIEQYNQLADQTAEYQATLVAEKEKSDTATKAKSEFLAVMTHELRTPLNGVIGMSDLLKEAQLNEKHANYLSIINQSGKQLLSVINDILDFSKIESGQMELHPVRFCLILLAKQVIELLAFQAREKGLDLKFENNSDMTTCFLLGDDVRIRQILINLVNNAIKFTHEGKVEVVLTVEYELSTHFSFALAVKDSGIGLTREEKEKLFKQFSQADASTTREYGGTGLGLAICKHLSQKMGGSISVESKKGEGSTFTLQLTLPIADGVESVDDLSAVQPWDKSWYVQHGIKPRILVVDDTPINQELAAAVLETEDMEVITASNGIEAVALSAEQSPDLILMDCLMPEMDGFDATKAIRKREKENAASPTPVIALTASALNETKDKCIEAGMDDFLSKPLNSSQLIEKVRALLLRQKSPDIYKKNS